MTLLRLLLALVVGASGGTGVALAQESVEVPVVEVYLQDAGGDAIDLYAGDTSSDVYALMTDVAYAFGDVPDEPSVTDYRAMFDDTRTAGAQFEGRLLRRSGPALELRFDTRQLSAVMADHGYRAYRLRMCPPDVRRRLHLEPPTALDGFGCPSWEIDTRTAPVRVNIALLPDVGEYTRLVVTLLAVALTASVAAALVATLLRRRLIRSFGGGAIAAAIIGVAAAVIVPFVAMVVLANAQRPVSSLVLAHDLTVPRQIAATVLPSLLLAAPGVVFAVIALLAPLDVSRLAQGQASPAGQPRQGGPGLPAWLDR